MRKIDKTILTTIYGGKSPIMETLFSGTFATDYLSSLVTMNLVIGEGAIVLSYISGNLLGHRTTLKGAAKLTGANALVGVLTYGFGTFITGQSLQTTSRCKEPSDEFAQFCYVPANNS